MHGGPRPQAARFRVLDDIVNPVSMRALNQSNRCSRACLALLHVVRIRRSSGACARLPCARSAEPQAPQPAGHDPFSYQGLDLGVCEIMEGPVRIVHVWADPEATLCNGPGEAAAAAEYFQEEPGPLTPKALGPRWHARRGWRSRPRGGRELQGGSRRRCRTCHRRGSIIGAEAREGALNLHRLPVVSGGRDQRRHLRVSLSRLLGVSA